MKNAIPNLPRWLRACVAGIIAFGLCVSSWAQAVDFTANWSGSYAYGATRTLTITASMLPTGTAGQFEFLGVAHVSAGDGFGAADLGDLRLVTQSGAKSPGAVFSEAYTSGTVYLTLGGTLVADSTRDVTPSTYKIDLFIPANNTDHDILYRFIQDGGVVQYTVQSPGAAGMTYHLTGLPNAHRVSIDEVLSSYVTTSGGVIYTGNPSDTISRAVSSGGIPLVSTVTAPTVSVPGPSSPGETIGGVSAPVVVPARTRTDGNKANVFQPGADVAAAGGSSSDFSIAAYREGVDKQTDAVKTTGETLGSVLVDMQASINATQSSVGAGISSVLSDLRGDTSAQTTAVNATTTAVSGVGSKIDSTNSKLDTANAHLAAIEANTAGGSGREETTGEASARAATAASAASQGAAASAAVATAMSGKQAGSDSVLAFTVPEPGGGVPAELTIHLPAKFGGAEIDLNPFREDRIGPAVSWFRSAVAWAVVVAFGVWLWKKLEDYTTLLSVAKQAKGNPVVAGTGGQATALIAAGAITTIFATTLVAVLGWSFGELTFPAIVAKMHTNPLTGLAASALWLLNQPLPIATILTAVVGRLVFQMYALPIYMSALTLVRFVVP